MGYTEKISVMTLTILCRHSIAIYINHWEFNHLSAESHFDKLSSFTCIRNLFSKLGKSYIKTARHVSKSMLSCQWFIFVSVDLHLKAYSDNFVIILWVLSLKCFTKEQENNCLLIPSFWKYIFFHYLKHLWCLLSHSTLIVISLHFASVFESIVRHIKQNIYI